MSTGRGFTERTALTPGDGELLALLYSGEVDALEALYDRYSGYVMAIALRIVGGRADAEEVVQDVFWQLWKARLRYDPARGRFSTWLFAVARNRALDRVRGGKRRPDLDVGGTPPERPGANAPAVTDPEMDASLAERRRVVQAALGSLSGDQRQVIELAYYAGFSHSEIASRLGEPVGTVKSRIKRGMAKLRETLVSPGMAP